MTQSDTSAPLSWRLVEAECRDAMSRMEPDSIDAVVTDPPYGLEFMGKEWDRLMRPGNESPHSRRHSVSFVNPGNPTCRNCGGLRSLESEGSGGRKRCRCDTPDFPNHLTPRAQAMQEWHFLWATEALRVLKPGGHLLAFGGTRTFHRLTCALEDAGFEIRDCLSWLYGSGFPKSLDVSKAIDKAAGVEREVVVGTKLGRPGMAKDGSNQSFDSSMNTYGEGGVLSSDITAPATETAQRWQGWGTALKPAWEPIILARKPLDGNVAANVQAHGSGALNIDGTRIETDGRPHREARKVQENEWDGGGQWKSSGFGEGETSLGRWPANVILDEEAAAMLDEQTGNLPPGVTGTGSGFRTQYVGGEYKPGFGDRPWGGYGDTGGASRFFYCPKADREERDRGLEGFHAARLTDDGYGSIQTPILDRATPRENWTPHEARNPHPTVKPVELMRWLCRLVTPPGGTVLDPFTGSGTTGIAALREGFSFIGIEREPEYVEIARARIQGDAPLFNVQAEVSA